MALCLQNIQNYHRYICSPAPQPEQCPCVRCPAHLREALLVIRRGRAERGTVQYSAVQYSTVQYSTVQNSAVQYSTEQCSTVQYRTVQYSTVMYVLCAGAVLRDPVQAPGGHLGLQGDQRRHHQLLRHQGTQVRSMDCQGLSINYLCPVIPTKFCVNESKSKVYVRTP